MPCDQIEDFSGPIIFSGGGPKRCGGDSKANARIVRHFYRIVHAHFEES